MLKKDGVLFGVCFVPSHGVKNKYTKNILEAEVLAKVVKMIRISLEIRFNHFFSIYSLNYPLPFEH